MLSRRNNISFDPVLECDIDTLALVRSRALNSSSALTLAVAIFWISAQNQTRLTRHNVNGYKLPLCSRFRLELS